MLLRGSVGSVLSQGLIWGPLLGPPLIYLKGSDRVIQHLLVIQHLGGFAVMLSEGQIRLLAAYGLGILFGQALRFLERRRRRMNLEDRREEGLSRFIALTYGGGFYNGVRF